MSRSNTENPSQADWYVLRTSTRSETRIASILELKGYETLLPFGLIPRSQGRTAPLFPGYLFCQMDPVHPLPVLQTPGVQSLLSYGNSPVPLEPAEIATLKALSKDPVSAEPHPSLCKGQPVRIIKGALTGVEGVLAEIRNSHRVALRLNVLERSVLLDISMEHVETC